MNTVVQAKAFGHSGRVLEASTEAKAAADERRAEKWIDAKIAEASGSLLTTVTDLTPALARVLLNRNPGNRQVSGAFVERFARDMANGKWTLNGEPIIVSADGHLNDGQHRCHAVIRANRSAQVVIVIGADRDSRFTLDQGKTRMAGDYLGMEGHADPIALAAVATYAWQHRNHGRLSQQVVYRPSKSEILAFVEAHPDLASSLAAIPNKGAGSLGGRSILAFCRWTFVNATDEPTADRFISMLVSGASLSVGDPILYARNRIVSEGRRIQPHERAELIFRAWGAHRRGEKPKTLQIQGGLLPAVER